MAPGVLRDKGRPWSWTQFAIALGLIPISFLSWWVGMETAVFRPESDPEPPLIGWLCLVASPFIAIAGGLWLLVLLVRRFWAAPCQARDFRLK
jgi:hypothetical protein